MNRALKAIWGGLLAVYNDLFRSVAINIIWALGTIPFAAIILFVTAKVRDPQTQDATLAFALAGLLAILIANPFATGIYYYANQTVRDERVELSTYWSGLRLYWQRGLVLFLVNFVIIALIGFNISFYLNVPDTIWLRLIAILWLYALLAWVCIQFYLGPLLIEQKNKNVFLLFRNAGLVAVDNLFYTLILLIVELFFIGLAIVISPIAALLIKSVLAMIESVGFASILEKYEERERQAAAAAAPSDPGGNSDPAQPGEQI